MKYFLYCSCFGLAFVLLNLVSIPCSTKLQILHTNNLINFMTSIWCKICSMHEPQENTRIMNATWTCHMPHEHATIHKSHERVSKCIEHMPTYKCIENFYHFPILNQYEKSITKLLCINLNYHFSMIVQNQ